MAKKKIKEEKKDSVVFTALLESSRGESAELTYGELTVKVSSLQPLSKRIDAISAGVDFLFRSNANKSDAKKIDDYKVYAREFIERYAAIIYFTDISFGSLSTDEMWNIVNSSPLYDDVAKIVGDACMNTFIFEMGEMIELKKEELVRFSNLSRLLDFAVDMSEKLAGNFKDFDFSKIISSLGDVKGLDGLDINSILQSVMTSLDKNT